MPQHVIVDGSNLATEGRSLPSLQQLNEAIASYRDDHPDALITVVVDATFGHRIDPREVPAFEKAIETNAFVAPPAGAVGRGDGFILSIAQKAKASILSNDSYQEFHGEYAWLFDEGRLIGGKPVPHVGWVFVDRVPVRGPISRRSVKEQKAVDKLPSRGRSRKTVADSVPAISADGPMPVPKSTPPGAVMPNQRSTGDAKPTAQRNAAPQRAASRSNDGRSTEVKTSDAPSNEGRQTAAARSANDLLVFLSFVEHYPVGTAVTAIVETYSSHGAYVAIGDAKGYVPLRLMADPAPRSAREVMGIGETVTLVVSSFGPARRSIDLAVPAMAPPAPPVAPPKVRKSAARKAAAGAAEMLETTGIAAQTTATEAAQVAESVEVAALAAGKTPRARKASARKAAEPKGAALAAGKTPRAPKASARKAAEPKVAAAQPKVVAQPKKVAAPPKSAAATDKPPLAATFDSVFEADARIEPAAEPPAKRAGPPRRGGAKKASGGAAAAEGPTVAVDIDRVALSVIEAVSVPTKRARATKAGPAAAESPPSAAEPSTRKSAGRRRPADKSSGS